MEEGKAEAVRVESLLPQDFLTRMQEWLREEYPLFLESFLREEEKGLRRNPLKIGKEAFEERLPYLKEPVPWAENGYYYDKEDQPGLHPYHQAGLYYIQEPSAMAVAEQLQARPGERILDLCAAPGGKSTQIAGAMKQQGLLVCNEPHPARAAILSENIERMGIRNALVTNEMPGKLAERFPEYFHRILVDAPCSGEGMFRKNEEAIAQWSPENVRLCAERQDEILRSAAAMLQPGGRLVYSTCTFSEEENEGSISRFLAEHSSFRLLHSERLWPHKIRGEGHFVAVLEKAGEKADTTEQEGGRKQAKQARQEQQAESRLRTKKSLPEREVGDFLEFVKTSLRIKEDWRLCLFGEQLYHLPQEVPELAGLKVLRAGLHLGTLKKKRFEPSHALALTLAPGQVCHSWNLQADDSLAKAYLAGQTFPAEGEKGWYLITVDGYSLGWGKLAGTIMKNHYPKGLRR